WPRDWSSDVCSSDLRNARVPARSYVVRHTFLWAARGDDGLANRDPGERRTDGRLDLSLRAAWPLAGDDLSGLPWRRSVLSFRGQIGRASCREKVSIA